MKWQSRRKRMAPYSPRLMTSVCGPRSMILAAARRRLNSPESRHASLEVGLDVAEEKVGLGAIAVGQLGIEIGEDVEVGAERLAIVHIGRIFSGPEEGLAGNAIEAGEVDLAGGEEVDIFLREILADHA